MLSQSETPINLIANPQKAALLNAFVGKPLNGLRTPAMIVDRKLFAQNCATMHRKAKMLGATFRAHLKTHKTVEGTKLQLVSEEATTHAVVVSTMMEAWEVVRGGLVADSTVKDILYGLPVALNKIADLSQLRQELEIHGAVLRILIDHPDQVKFLEDFESHQDNPKRWQVFIKINAGLNRAGVLPGSPELSTLLKLTFSSPAIFLHGFYAHGGQSYASTSLSEAAGFLTKEVEAVNSAAEHALAAISPSLNERVSQAVSGSLPFVLSVGSTPTAHAASAETRTLLSQFLHGTLELHAGNYPMLDLQQHHTGLIRDAQISQRVRATVISYYPGRGPNGVDEAMVDAGALAFSKDTGPSGTFGEVVGMPSWSLTRISQEHGLLTCKESGLSVDDRLKLGSVVDIVGQHACLIAAAYPWYYIVDQDVEDGKKIVDVWVPWKGW